MSTHLEEEARCECTGVEKSLEFGPEVPLEGEWSSVDGGEWDWGRIWKSTVDLCSRGRTTYRLNVPITGRSDIGVPVVGKTGTSDG